MRNKLIHDHPEVVAQNSFSNFHAKGLDYLCLQRSKHLTVKAYFYDDDAAATCPEVVCPHDHRYPFSTHILAGRSRHYRYATADEPNYDTFVHQRFLWDTPLNGGAGFTWYEDVNLIVTGRETHAQGSSYWCRADEFHTIAIHEPQTVLLLFQHDDVVPIGSPTNTFVPGYSKEPPSLDGLYDRMTVDRARELLGVVDALCERAPF